MKKWHKITLSIIGTIVLVGAYLFLYEPRYDGPLVVDGTTRVFAHRGFGLYAPDNSLLGVERALEKRMDGVDVDGQITVDGELIIYHDLSVDRLTDGTGKVAAKTLAEMQSLDLGPHFDPSLTGAYVTTFEEFLTTINGTAGFMVELKVPTTAPTGIEERAIEIIRKHNAYDWVYLSSFNPLVIYRLEKIEPRVNTMLIFMDTNWSPALLAEIPDPADRVDLPWALRQEPIRRAIRKIVKPDLLSVNHEVNAATRARLIEKGWPVFLWTPNDAASINAALVQHPYGVITDEPLLGKELRNTEAARASN